MEYTPMPADIFDIDVINQIIESDINKKLGGHQETMLHWMARHGRIDNVKYLVERGADINARDRYMCTPLHDAAFNGRTEIVKYLLLNGADKFAKNNNESTVMTIISSWSRSDGLVEFVESFEPVDPVPTKGVHDE